MNFTALGGFESMLSQANASPSVDSLKEEGKALSHQKTKARSSRNMSEKGLSYQQKSLSLSISAPPKKAKIPSSLSHVINDFLFTLSVRL